MTHGNGKWPIPKIIWPFATLTFRRLLSPSHLLGDRFLHPLQDNSNKAWSSTHNTRKRCWNKRIPGKRACCKGLGDSPKVFFLKWGMGPATIAGTGMGCRWASTSHIHNPSVIRQSSIHNQSIHQWSAASMTHLMINLADLQFWTNLKQVDVDMIPLTNPRPKFTSWWRGYNSARDMPITMMISPSWHLPVVDMYTCR